MTCLKCQSNHIIPDVRVLDRGHGHVADLTIAVEVERDNVLLSGSQKSTLRAQVCADCGFTELYATNPDKLWAAMLANQSS